MVNARRPAVVKDRVVSAENANVFDRAARWALVEVHQHALNEAAARVHAAMEETARQQVVSPADLTVTAQLERTVEGLTQARVRYEAICRSAPSGADAWRDVAQAQMALNAEAEKVEVLQPLVILLRSAIEAYHELMPAGVPRRLPGVGGLS